MRHKMNIADIVTGSRIVFAALLLFYPAFSKEFYCFYFLGALSDMIDGTIARKLKLNSSFGAKLDTIADSILIGLVLIKVLFYVYVPRWLWIWIGIIAVIKLINLISGLVMFRSFVPEHTAMNKLTGFMLFLLPLGIGRGSWQAAAVAVIATCLVATFAAIQEGHYIRSGKRVE